MVIEKSLRSAISDFKRLRSYLEKNNLESTVGVEEGFSPTGFDDIMVLDTIDDWIVDFALKAEADFVKFGGIERGERIVKYNRLLELGMP